MSHRHLQLFAVLLISTFVASCASTGPHALNPRGPEDPSLVKHGVVAMSLDMTNEFNPKWGPWKLGGYLSGSVVELGKSGKDTFEGGMTYFPGPGVGMGDGIKKGRTDMPAIAILPAGTYRLTGIVGSSMPGIIGAGIHFPISSEAFKVEAGKGVYIGHISILAKEKTPSDYRSLDQLVGQHPNLGHTTFIGQTPAKFSKTTPVLSFSNRYEESIKELKQDYPYLVEVKFDNLPLKIYAEGSEKKSD